MIPSKRRALSFLLKPKEFCHALNMETWIHCWLHKQLLVWFCDISNEDLTILRTTYKNRRLSRMKSQWKNATLRLYIRIWFIQLEITAANIPDWYKWVVLAGPLVFLAAVWQSQEKPIGVSNDIKNFEILDIAFFFLLLVLQDIQRSCLFTLIEMTLY